MSRHLKLAGEELWSIYSDEKANGKTTLGWSAWLDEIRAFKPRLIRMFLSVRFAIAGMRG